MTTFTCLGFVHVVMHTCGQRFNPYTHVHIGTGGGSRSTDKCEAHSVSRSQLANIPAGEGLVNCNTCSCPASAGTQ